MKYLFPILFLFIISCDDNDSADSADSDCIGNAIYSNIDGITPTDAAGNVLSNGDDNDWNCCIGDDLPKRVDDAILPSVTSISPAYPNPSNGTIIIAYTLNISTSISIYAIDISGNIVDTIVDDEYSDSGNHMAVWNPNNEGIYRIIIESENDEGFYCYGDVCYCPNYENCDSFCDY